MEFQPGLRSSDVHMPLSTNDYNGGNAPESARFSNPQSQGLLPIMPKGKSVQEAVRMADIAIKCEMAMHEMNSILYFSSLLSFLIWIFGFFLFLSFTSQMGLIFIHSLHIIRAIVGWCLLKKTPKSHDVIAGLGLPEEAMELSKLKEVGTENFKKLMMNYASACQKLLMIYFTITVLCVLTDSIDFIIELVAFGRPGQEYSVMMLLILSVIFLVIDFYYIVWIQSMKHNFPPNIANYVSRALKGGMNKMRAAMMTGFYRLKSRFSSENPDTRQQQYA